jgi:hypothetical protein
MPAAQRRFKIASKSFEGLHVLATRRPDVVLMYVVAAWKAPHYETYIPPQVSAL